MKVSKKLTCESFLNNFIEKTTVKFSDVKFSLGCLVDTVEKNKHFERDYKEFFDIMIIKDFTKETRAIFPDENGIGYYCGNLRNINERLVRKVVLSTFEKMLCEYDKDITPLDQYKNFLESANEWPDVNNNESATRNVKLLLDSINDGRDNLFRGYTSTEHATDILIIPILFRKGLEMKHDNLLKHTNCDYMLKVLNMMKWKSGLKDVLNSFDISPEDINIKGRKEKLYKILL